MKQLFRTLGAFILDHPVFGVLAAVCLTWPATGAFVDEELTTLPTADRADFYLASGGLVAAFFGGGITASALVYSLSGHSRAGALVERFGRAVVRLLAVDLAILVLFSTILVLLTIFPTEPPTGAQPRMAVGLVVGAVAAISHLGAWLTKLVSWDLEDRHAA